MAEKPSYSISIRLRRTIYQEAFVSVPVDDAVKQDAPDAQGRFSLDGDKVMSVAARLGKNPTTHWITEGDPVIEVHPVQTAPNDDLGDPTKIH
jgi:hypothetical protein